MSLRSHSAPPIIQRIRRTGSETKWWEAYKIEPLSIAHQLWARSQQLQVAPTVAAEPGTPKICAAIAASSLLMQPRALPYREARHFETPDYRRFQVRRRAIVKLSGFSSEPGSEADVQSVIEIVG